MKILFKWNRQALLAALLLIPVPAVSANDAYVEQAGDTHDAEILQIGTNNGGFGGPGSISASIIQSGGNGNDGYIEQNGSDNKAGITQAGSLNASFVAQIGSGNSATVHQPGTGNQAFITQNSLSDLNERFN